MELAEHAARHRPGFRHVIGPVSDHGADGTQALGTAARARLHHGGDAGADCLGHRIRFADCFSGNGQGLPSRRGVRGFRRYCAGIYRHCHRQHDGGDSGAWCGTRGVHCGALGMWVRHRYCERTGNQPDGRLGEAKQRSELADGYIADALARRRRPGNRNRLPFSSKGTYTYGNRADHEGNKYVGEWKEGKRHGQGTEIINYYLTSDLMGYMTGIEEYVGNWENNERNGQGTSTNYSKDGTGNTETYIGEWKEGERHGKGTKISRNRIRPDVYAKSEYVGEWQYGQPHGKGTETWTNGTYVGEWKNGRRHGQGMETTGNGAKYVGEWRKGERWNGKGKFDQEKLIGSTDKYIGEWKKGKFNGQATESDSDGTYSGEYKYGKRHGKGTCVFKFPYGYKYVGEWKYGERNGYGVVYSDTGLLVKKGNWEKSQFIGNKKVNYVNIARYEGNYTGEMKNGERHGKGTYIYYQKGDSIEKKYVGEWKNGERNGKGEYTEYRYGSSNGIRYVGDWKNDERNGYGTETFGNGKILYEGQWEDDKRHGQGQLEYDRHYEQGLGFSPWGYIGEWKNGERHGQGTYTDREVKYVGRWKNDRYHGTGTQYIYGVKSYEGEWRKNEYHGYGILYNPDGSIEKKGYWESGEYVGE